MKKICLVDVTSQDRPLPGLDVKTRPSSTDDQSPDVDGAPWKIGFSECRGKQNRCDCNVLLHLFLPFYQPFSRRTWVSKFPFGFLPLLFQMIFWGWVAWVFYELDEEDEVYWNFGAKGCICTIKDGLHVTSQQCQDTDGSSKHWPKPGKTAHYSHPLLIHCQTAEGALSLYSGSPYTSTPIWYFYWWGIIGTANVRHHFAVSRSWSESVNNLCSSALWFSCVI